MKKEEGMTYRQAGVDISKGNEAVEMIKPLVEKTYRQEVLGGLGGFGALFAPDLKDYQCPVLVAGTDGVGTKLAVAHKVGKHDTIGIDCVAMCVNDILVSGAEPLFFLDYLAVGRLEPSQVSAIVAGIAEGCRQAGCALIGGETAEMPGFYRPGEYDVAGFAVGVVDKEKIIDGSSVKEGDVVVGLASNGLHSNGYSLARKVFFDACGWGTDKYLPELGRTLGEEMLRPTRIYVKLIKELLKEIRIKGMAHITGGGLLENPARNIPPGTHIEIEYGSWKVPPVFELLSREGKIAVREMLRTFNMGIGYILIVAAEDVDRLQEVLQAKGEECSIIGRVVQGEPGVTIGGIE